MIKIAIFASGSGSNAQKISEHFNNVDGVEVSLIVTNNPNAYVLQRAEQLNIPSHIFNRESFYKTEDIVSVLKDAKIDFIVLAGFMWLVPKYLVAAYPDKIVNIHPALLPKFGGKGMYGDHVHKAVKEAGETESGITIHYVNEAYDEGNIIFQAKCKIEELDTSDSIAEKVHALEYKHYPKVIESVIQKSFKNE